MGNTRRDGARSAVLALSLALGGESAVHAQDPGLSSGSGVGTGAGAGAMSTANTGAGAMTGAPRSGSGMMSGRGPGSPMEGGRALPLGPARGNIPFGPGVDVSFPNDPYLVPFLLSEQVFNPAVGKAAPVVTPELLNSARRVPDPAERSLALRQIANGAIASNQLGLAHHILEEATAASSHVTVPLVRDQRLIGLVSSLTLSTDALLRVGREALGAAGSLDRPSARPDAVSGRPEIRRQVAQLNQRFDKEIASGNFNRAVELLRALPSTIQEKVQSREISEADGRIVINLAGGEMARKLEDTVTRVMIPLARLEWRRAVYLASIIGNPTYRNEMLYDIAEDEAKGSASLANDFARAFAMESLGNPPPEEAPPPTPTPVAPDRAPQAAGNRPGAGTAPALPPERAGTRDDVDATYAKLADQVLVDAWNVARKIDRLLWKNRSMVRIALSASDSRQYRRGVELARTVENAESRSEALLLLAEGECRHHEDASATRTYQAAAEAVASIPQAGLRGVMTGFLIDSLIASGRFDDARACTVIYPEESQRFVALGAIAESQGWRGLADSARRWIATEAPPAYRSALLRRVVKGVLLSVETERSKEEPLGGEPLPPARRSGFDVPR